MATSTLNLIYTANPDGIASSNIQTVGNSATASWSFYIPPATFGALFLEICGMSTTGAYTYVFKNLGVKNPSGSTSPTIYGFSTLTNVLGSPTPDLAMSTAGASLSTPSANLITVTFTGPSAGSLTVNWQCWCTYKMCSP